ncbi:MAG: universal stress protein [Natronomonas sp.]|nr:universal stress protein [Natronomonas sp.]
MKRILVPLDGSSESEAALREAFDLFPEAEVHAFHVVQVTEFPRDRNKSAYEIAVEKGREILTRADEIADKHERGIETAMKEGHAAKTIVRYAEENDIDHIVMGSTGRSGMARVLLGSVAESVTRRAPCSVVIVREN